MRGSRYLPKVSLMRSLARSVLDGGGEQGEGAVEGVPEPLGELSLALGAGGQQLGVDLARPEETPEVQLVFERLHVELGHRVDELKMIIGEALQLCDEALDEDSRHRGGDREHDQEEGGDGEDLQPVIEASSGNRPLDRRGACRDCHGIVAGAAHGWGPSTGTSSRWDRATRGAAGADADRSVSLVGAPGARAPQEALIRVYSDGHDQPGDRRKVRRRPVRAPPGGPAPRPGPRPLLGRREPARRPTRPSSARRTRMPAFRHRHGRGAGGARRRRRPHGRRGRRRRPGQPARRPLAQAARRVAGIRHAAARRSRASASATSATPWRSSWPRRGEQAVDAAALVAVDYEPLPAVAATAEAAARARLPSGTRRPTTWPSCGRPDSATRSTRAFESAAHVTRLDFVVTRVAAAPLEPRAAVGEYDRRTGRYTLHTGIQGPHGLRAPARRRAARAAEPPARRDRRRRRELRDAQRHLSGAGAGAVGGAAAGPAGEVDVRSARGLRQRRARPRQRLHRRAGPRRADGKFLALRVAITLNIGAYFTPAQRGAGHQQRRRRGRRVHDAGHPRADHRRLHEHHAHRARTAGPAGPRRPTPSSA